MTDRAKSEMEVPHVGDWQDQYPTTTYRGPQEYPVPEDWVLNIVEGDGVMWKRYEDVGQDCKHDNEAIEARGGGMDAGTPDENASLGIGSEMEFVEDENGEIQTKMVADPPDHELTINGKTVFEAWEPVDSDVLWAATAEILARHSRGEDYEEIAEAVDGSVDPDEPEVDLSLEEFQ